MKYRDGEYGPELGDAVDVYSEEFEPETAKVNKIGKKKILIIYDNDCIKPRSEWVCPLSCELVAREI